MFSQVTKKPESLIPVKVRLIAPATRPEVGLPITPMLPMSITLGSPANVVVVLAVRALRATGVTVNPNPQSPIDWDEAPDKPYWDQISPEGVVVVAPTVQGQPPILV